MSKQDNQTANCENQQEVVEEVVTKKVKENKKSENVSKQKYDEVVSQLEKSNNDLQDALKLAEDNKQSWYRCAADFENFKKRNNETRANAYLDGKSDAIKSLFVIGDNLDRALLSVQDEKTKQGLELVIKQYNETLKNLGVNEINPVGQPFDPNFHEAVMQAECEEGEESGNVKTVFQKGYSLNGKILRYAQVVINK